MAQAPVTADEVRGWVQRVADAPLVRDDAALIDEVRELETLKAAVEARQARLAVQFDASQREVAAERGVPAARRGRGVAEQIALARRVSPHRGRILLGLAKAVVNEMPHTARAWRSGRITEWRATLLARETACLSRSDRTEVDLALAGDPAALEAKSEREVVGQARRLAARLDAASVAERRRRAESDRCVTIRPAPDAMVYLTALLPVAQGVAVYSALKQAADTSISTGAATSRGQVMADALVQRVTGAPTDENARPLLPVAVHLVMPDRTLLEPSVDSGDEEAELDGYGPIPAGLARELVADALDARSKVWLRRLYARPLTGRLVAMDSDRRLFPKQLADFIGLRDRFCRNPWCDARIRHRDHIQPVNGGGTTSEPNGQGLCEQCNHAKQQPGWRYRTVPDPSGTHTVEITTPTGHAYRSTAPPAPGSGIDVKLDLRFAA